MYIWKTEVNIFFKSGSNSFYNHPFPNLANTALVFLNRSNSVIIATAVDPPYYILKCKLQHQKLFIYCKFLFEGFCNFLAKYIRK